MDRSDVPEAALATREHTSPAHEARKPTDADRFEGLRQGRREPGLTQEALAALLGVTSRQIQKYEAGHSRMSAGQRLEIAAALGRPIGWFYEPFEIAPSAAAGRGRDLQAHDRSATRGGWSKRSATCQACRPRCGCWKPSP